MLRQNKAPEERDKTCKNAAGGAAGVRCPRNPPGNANLLIGVSAIANGADQEIGVPRGGILAGLVDRAGPRPYVVLVHGQNFQPGRWGGGMRSFTRQGAREMSRGVSGPASPSTWQGVVGSASMWMLRQRR